MNLLLFSRSASLLNICLLVLNTVCCRFLAERNTNLQRSNHDLTLQVHDLRARLGLPLTPNAPEVCNLAFQSLVFLIMVMIITAWIGLSLWFILSFKHYFISIRSWVRLVGWWWPALPLPVWCPPRWALRPPGELPLLALRHTLQCQIQTLNLMTLYP